jgi:Glyoxalase/Bleomycin resistance protein/Dioxygenase superfamily.
MPLIHVCLNVTDADRIADWYVEQLGFEYSWEFTTEDGTGRNVYVADDNGIELQISDTDDEHPDDPGTLYDHIALGVDNVDDTFAEIDHFGAVKEPGDQPAAGARTAFVKDPDGHVVELVEPLE